MCSSIFKYVSVSALVDAECATVLTSVTKQFLSLFQTLRGHQFRTRALQSSPPHPEPPAPLYTSSSGPLRVPLGSQLWPTGGLSACQSPSGMHKPCPSNPWWVLGLCPKPCIVKLHRLDGFTFWGLQQMGTANSCVDALLTPLALQLHCHTSWVQCSVQCQ